MRRTESLTLSRQYLPPRGGTSARLQFLRERFVRVELPLVLSLLLVGSVLTVLIQRQPISPARTVVAGGSSPVEDFSPPPLPEASAIPSEAPRIVAPRAPGARTQGSSFAAPRAVGGLIQIPAIGASAPLVAVGLDSNGQMVTPKNARDVAWLDNGTFPGPTRNAVMAGHRNWKGSNGTFARLEKLRAGDVVRVGIDGRSFTFAVSWVRVYDPRNAPIDELMGATPSDAVTLVTCGGEYDRSEGHYAKRVVARAELVSVA